MEGSSLKDRLIESTVVDPSALDSIEESNVLGDMPIWMVVMIALLFAIASAGAMKERTEKQRDNSKDIKK